MSPRSEPSERPPAPRPRRAAKAERPGGPRRDTLQRLFKLGDKQQARTVKRVLLVVVSLAGLAIAAHTWFSPWLQYRGDLQHVFERGTDWQPLLTELAARETYDPDLYSLIVRAAGEHENPLAHTEYLRTHLREAAVDTVLAACKSARPVRRTGALTVLSRLAWTPDGVKHPAIEARAEEIIAVALTARLDADSDVRNIALTLLEEFPSAAAGVLPLADDPAPEVRIVCAQTLGEFGDSASVAALERLLDDPDERVQVQAAVSLLPHRPETVRPRLRRRAVEPAAIGRLRSIFALLDSAGPDLRTLWIELARDVEAEVRKLSVRGLAPFPSREIREVLEALTTDPDFHVRVEAIAALGQRANKAALPALVRGLKQARTVGDKDAFFRAVVELADTPVPEAALDRLGSLPASGSDAQREALLGWLDACLAEAANDTDQSQE